MAGISLMDLLFAEALASGMARGARQERRPPPDNFFVLPREPQAWRQLRDVCRKEHLVIAVEVTESGHEGSQRIQPLFVELAREFDGVPFLRLGIGIGIGGTYDELRKDLGGVQYCPTILAIFFDDDEKISRAKFEGEMEIRRAVNSGRMKAVIGELLTRRRNRKAAESFAEQLAEHMSDREKKIRIEYESRMKQQEEALRKEAEEKMKKEEEEKKKKEAEEKQMEAEKRRRLEERRESRPRHLRELLQMDLDMSTIRDIRAIMTNLSVPQAGCLSRGDLKARLMENVPELRRADEQRRASTSSVSSMASTSSSVSDNFGDPLGAVNSQLQTQRDRATRQERRADQLEQEKVTLEAELRKLRSRLKEKETESFDCQSDLRRMTQRANSAEEKLLAVTKAQKLPVSDSVPSRPVPKPRSSSSSSSSSASSDRMRELETQLLETRMLYTTTIEEYDILGSIHVRGDEGMVLRAKCTRKDIPNPDRVYAMKVLANYFQQQTVTQVRVQFQNEYSVLCQIPPHENIIHMFAFFFDRVNPDVSPEFRKMGRNARTMSLFLLLEEHSMSMKDQLEILVENQGPKPAKVLSWLRDVLTGLEFLQSQHVIHRDLKLDNLLVDSVGKRVVISDFGKAVVLDTTMKVPYNHGYDIGGNRAHMCPEVLNAKPGPRGTISYIKQPVWAAGILAYELAGHTSPFEAGTLDQRGYDIDQVPPLKFTYSKNSKFCQSLPSGLTALVRNMLLVEACDRPTIQSCLKTVNSLCATIN